MLYTLVQAMTRVADRRPTHDAMRFAGESLTYEDLDRRSNALSHVLQDLGVRRGDRVGLYAGKSLHIPVAMYGVMKAGAAYVPMNPEAPPDQLQKIIADCGIRHLVTEHSKRSVVQTLIHTMPSLAGVGVPGLEGATDPWVDWDDVWTAPTDAPANPDVIEQDLAYVMYTSGSTGTPKGIAHTHRSALSFAEVAAMTYELGKEDRITNHAPLHFDLSTLDYFATAVAGGTTIMIPESHTKFPASLALMLAEERVTVLYAVPFALIQLLLRGALNTHDLKPLRWVLFGGEPFPTKHLRELMRQIPQARFSNVYGPTETNGCTYYVVPPLPADSDAPIPIGGPYANVEALVLDEDDTPLAVGATGELAIRSPTRMRGYWGQPELTSQATFRRATPAGDDDLFHRTGDLVQTLPDGSFHLLGRKDRQIKTRGHRVELDEIEAALHAHKSVEEAATFPVPDGEGSQRIEAVVTLRNRMDGKGDVTGGRPSEILKFLKKRLPRYAVPAKIDVIDEFPRTTTGKIDRRRLREQSLLIQDQLDTAGGS